MRCFEKWVYKIEKLGFYAKIDRNFSTDWCEYFKIYGLLLLLLFQIFSFYNKYYLKIFS